MCPAIHIDEVALMNLNNAYPSLRDRVVLITGGASGIGANLVEAFCRQQACVSFIDIRDDEAENLKTCIDANVAKSIRESQGLKHSVMPEDISAMALFLSSDDSRMCTAQHFIVDGGWI
jgi:NAD(P)-dependent dehydrogenase (short-subunit alcohol dehydrogenase family)